MLKGTSKTEIDNFLQDKGDFVKIDYLNRFLKDASSIEMRKFAYLKTASIYEKMKMFSEAARSYENAAVSSITFSEKIENYTKACQCFIKVGDFLNSDKALRNAMIEANATQRNEIYLQVKEFYKRQAETYEKEMRRSHAIKIYEKLILMRISDGEKKEIKEKLKDIYRKLGKMQEANKLGLN